MRDAVYNTHRLVKNPKMSARYLADYMAASDSVRRSIIVKCKYPAIARIVQHKEANVAIARFLTQGKGDTSALKERAQALRERMADDEFDRDVLDHNADFIDRFVSVHHLLDFPKANLEAVGNAPPIDLSGVHLTVSLAFRLRRVTRTNEVRIGVGSLRYAKGSNLPPETGSWQAAILLGYLTLANAEAKAVPEGKLCVIVDARSGRVYPAPSDSIRRFKHTEAACTTIAEQWQNIPPPKGAVL